MPTGAGDLKHQVRFERRAADAAGDRTGAWQEQFTSRARLTPLRGGETVLEQRLAGVQPIVIRVRASQKTRQITTAWRGVNLATEVEYDVKSAAEIEDGDGVWIDIMAEARSGVG